MDEKHNMGFTDMNGFKYPPEPKLSKRIREEWTDSYGADELPDRRENIIKEAESLEEKLKNLEGFCEEVMMVSHDRRMKLEKTQELLNHWRDNPLEYSGYWTTTIHKCADKLEKILRGE